MKAHAAILFMLSLLPCFSQGWSVVGEPLAKQLGGGASNGVVCGQAPNFGSGWLEDMSVYTNCLDSDLISLPLNGVRVTWSQVTNCPTLEHYDRNLVYSMSWSPDGTTWTLINSQTNNTREAAWLTADVPAPYRTNGYYTVSVRESDWTGGGSPAIADWYYATNAIIFEPPNPYLSTGAENSVPGWRVISNLNVQVIQYEYDSRSGTTSGAPSFQALYSESSWGATLCSEVLTNYVLPAETPCHFEFYTLNPMESHDAWYSPCYLGPFNYLPHFRFHEDAHSFLKLAEAGSVAQSGGVISSYNQYGDHYDVMGPADAQMRINSFFREHIGWIGAYGVRPMFYAKQSGIYTISELNSTNQTPKSIKILRENVKKYSYVGTLAYVTNTFYYLELNGTDGTGFVMARLGTPLPYVHPSIHPQNNWTPNSYWVNNYGVLGNGLMRTGDSFTDWQTTTVIQQTGPSPAPWTTNTVRVPFSVAVLSATTTNATIAVMLQ